MLFKFYDLPYDYNALEPHIDATTMEIHHGKHHLTYYNKMEETLQNSEGATMSIERLLSSVGSMGPVIRNNAGGYYNHNIYWNSMSPDGGGDPSGALASAIDSAFDSADEFKKEMSNAGVGRFGYGSTPTI